MDVLKARLSQKKTPNGLCIGHSFFLVVALSTVQEGQRGIDSPSLLLSLRRAQAKLVSQGAGAKKNEFFCPGETILPIIISYLETQPWPEAYFQDFRLSQASPGAAERWDSLSLGAGICGWV